MATYYWVGGSGNWNATSKTNWATSSGGAGGAGVPTSADDVIFDANSNVGTGAFTVTVTGTISAPAVCRDFSTGGAGGALDGAMTITGTGTEQLEVYGSLTLPATNLTWTGVGGFILRMMATTTGKTLTTNGVSLASTFVRFSGVGGEWTLGSAITTTSSIYFDAGTFNSGNYNISVNILAATTATAKIVNFGSSTVTLTSSSPILFTGSNLTFNANTSTIICSTASITFAGSGLTFYNVSFTSSATGTVTITGANTYNNLTFTSRAATGQRNVSIGANQTVSGTLTFGTANTSVRRIAVFSDTIGTQRTITLNGTLATLADVDFRDIATAGTVGTWTGTRLGDGLNNSGITFPAGVNKYWNLAAGGNWSGTAWALSSGGAVAANNFPLAQDTIIIENTGLNTSATVTIDGNWWIGELNTSTRSNAFTLASGTTSPQFYKNLTLSSSVTLTGTGIFSFNGQGTTQTITSAGDTFSQGITVNSPSGTVTLADNLTSTGAFTLTFGTLNLSNKTLTCGAFSSSNSNARTVAMGTNGKIEVNGGNWTATTSTNLTVTGTGTIDMTSGSSKTFAGGGVTYPYTLNQGGLGALTITGANTFANISNSVQPCTITFPAAATTYVQNFTVSGTSGNLVTLNSSTPGTQWTLAKV